MFHKIVHIYNQQTTIIRRAVHTGEFGREVLIFNERDRQRTTPA